MAKSKVILKPPVLYRLIKHELIKSGIDDNPYNLKLILDDLQTHTQYFTDEIITIGDVQRSIIHIEHYWTALSFSLSRKNKTQLDQVNKYLKSLLKEDENV